MMLPELSILLLVALAASAASAAAKSLPSYITPCQRSSADFQACALASARAALPHIIQGDRKLRTPVLEPVRVTSLIIETPGAMRLKLNLTDIEITGLERTQIRELSIDLEGGKLEYILWTPRWQLLSQYEVTGQIILLPISGTGTCNITLEDMFWSTTVTFDKEKGPKGVDNLRVKDLELHSNHTRGFVQLDNLFSGNKLLGDQMNGFVNDNWRELSLVVSPFLEQATAAVFQQVFEGLFAKYTFDDIFPE